MNIFALHHEPYDAALAHCDKHVLKMVIEYAQLLSMSHRLLDGKPTIIQSANELGRVRARRLWLLPGETTKNSSPLYAVTHFNHPIAIWARSMSGNYNYLYELFWHLSKEYEHRYSKVHASFAKLHVPLRVQPKSIPSGAMTPMPLCMPDEYKVENNAVLSYQNFYVESKSRFARWTNRNPPQWFIERTPNYDKANFERTRNLAV